MYMCSRSITWVNLVFSDVLVVETRFQWRSCCWTSFSVAFLLLNLVFSDVLVVEPRFKWRSCCWTSFSVAFLLLSLVLSGVLVVEPRFQWRSCCSIFSFRCCSPLFVCLYCLFCPLYCFLWFMLSFNFSDYIGEKIDQYYCELFTCWRNQLKSNTFRRPGMFDNDKRIFSLLEFCPAKHLSCLI